MNGNTEDVDASEAISPLRMLVVLTCIVFVAELSIMVVLGKLMPMPEWIENLLDAFVLTALLFPALYYWIFRPMTLLIEKHRLAEVELLEIRDLLEHIAEVREQELQSAKVASDNMSAEIARLRGAHGK
jgi:hypothetical protein